MKVFIGCEYSGIVRDAFIKKGHWAVSCDVLDSESNYGDHITGDVVAILTNTPDNFYDLIICHPPLYFSVCQWKQVVFQFKRKRFCHYLDRRIMGIV